MLLNGKPESYRALDPENIGKATNLELSGALDTFASQLKKLGPSLEEGSDERLLIGSFRLMFLVISEVLVRLDVQQGKIDSLVRKKKWD